MPSPSLPFCGTPLLELRDDLGGEPAPCLAGSPFEVADVILALRDHEGSARGAALELSLTLDQVYAAMACHREHPELVDARIIACDFVRDRIDAELFEDEPAPRGRRTWRLATR